MKVEVFDLKEPVLLVMAAGMASRYGGGGLKQIDPMGPSGEIIIDYSIYDAIKAGFKKVVFVVKEDGFKTIRDHIIPGAGTQIDVEFVFQRMEDIPKGAEIPENRVKPWGTGHAVLSAANAINQPFAVINADDFYGNGSFKNMYQFLRSARDDSKYNYAMAGFYLENTVSENGYVSRGVCETNGGLLTDIVERTRIERLENGQLAYLNETGDKWIDIPGNSVVSMNFMGFTPSIFRELEESFKLFFKNVLPEDPEKAELFLPFVVNDLLKNEKAQVKVIPSSDQWYGVTYKEDKEFVRQAIQKLVDEGEYPANLWKR